MYLDHIAMHTQDGPHVHILQVIFGTTLGTLASLCAAVTALVGSKRMISLTGSSEAANCNYFPIL